MLAALLILVGLVQGARAIAWGVILDPTKTANNSWTSLSFTVTVPPTPPAEATGPWFFWAGLQPGLQCGALGVLQPVLQWGEYASCAVNDGQGIAQGWQLVEWAVPSANHAKNESATSCGIWLAPGDQISNNITYSGGVWTQSSAVVSGQAKGASVSLSVNASDYFCPQPGSGANFFLLESELYGPSLSSWTFPVPFTNLTLIAQTSEGVGELCMGQKGFGDGNGNATIEGLGVRGDGRGCGWGRVVLVPPP